MGRVTPSDGCAGTFLRAGVYGKLADDPSLRVTNPFFGATHTTECWKILKW
jgi:hypothetical protein